MANAYGNQVGHWKVKVNAWVVSSTATSDTIRVQAIAVMSSGWWTESSNCSASVWIQGVTDSSGASLGYQRLNPGERTVHSHDFVVGRTEDARSLSCRASLTVPYGEPGTSTASVNVNASGIKYKEPDEPSKLSIARVNDTSAKLTWKNNPDNDDLKPYKQLVIDRQGGTGGAAVGTTTITLTSGNERVTLPVTVRDNLLPKFSAGTQNGVTLAYEGTGIRFTGTTPTTFTQWSRPVTLEAGDYHADGDGALIKITAYGDTTGTALIDTRTIPQATLEAGRYTVAIALTAKQTPPDGIRHPYLERLD
ncbi:hypothetical protein [Bifidobacterium aerophilum]|uniref:Uncharacterized protein n=1 Tax=Bifidobacterium aerophilum TaxID=1798155 RepID=A0A6N9Z8A1_9BIFI|nr:hypothetical protein [Bifidobacterium aerophilum]NEG90610.1 hypothetical protein [Bifidobacterium aerophilum]